MRATVVPIDTGLVFWGFGGLASRRAATIGRMTTARRAGAPRSALQGHCLKTSGSRFPVPCFLFVGSRCSENPQRIQSTAEQEAGNREPRTGNGGLTKELFGQSPPG